MATGRNDKSTAAPHMTFVSIAPTALPDSASRSELGYRIVAVLWALYLFAPHKLLQFYIPDARPLTWMVELLLIAGTGLLVLTHREEGAPVRGYPAFTAIFLLTVFGLGMALAFGDLGRSRDVLRQMYQFYLLALLTLAYCDKPERAMLILKIYFWHFVYYGVWGAISLIRSPIIEGVDPGLRDIVNWHVSYGNRDAFGPLMAAGLTFSVYYFQAFVPRPKMAAVNVILQLIGIVTSYGRGVFLSLLAAAAAIFVHSRYKLRIALVVIACAVATPVVAPHTFARYAASMGTIFTEGADKGTGADRKVLWEWAWRVFKLNPVAGVGPGNFGIAVFDVVPLREAAQHEYSRNRLYGRVLHSTPMTVLAEYGLLGVIAMLFLIADFFKTNAAIRRTGAEVAGFPPGYVTAMSLGLQTAFITVCINSVFYEIFYISIAWNLLILNRMLYFACGADAGQLAFLWPWPSIHPRPGLFDATASANAGNELVPASADSGYRLGRTPLGQREPARPLAGLWR